VLDPASGLGRGAQHGAGAARAQKWRTDRTRQEWL